MHFTVPEFGAILLVVSGVTFWLKHMHDLSAIAGLVGMVLTGTGGWLGRVLTDTAGWVMQQVGSLTANFLGVAFTAALTIPLAWVFVHDVSPKKKAGARTVYIGWALGVLLAAGLTGIPALNGVRDGIVSAAGNVLNIL